jgi:hypothetical protein
LLRGESQAFPIAIHAGKIVARTFHVLPGYVATNDEFPADLARESSGCGYRGKLVDSTSRGSGEKGMPQLGRADGVAADLARLHAA